MPLSEFTVLVGRNNSGKTTLLEALSLLPHPGYKTPDPLNLGHRVDLLTRLHSKSRQDSKSSQESRQEPLSLGSLVYGYLGEAELRYGVGNRVLGFTLRDSNLSLTFDGQVVTDQDQELRGIFGDEPHNRIAFVPSHDGVLDELSKKIVSEGFWERAVKSGATVGVVKDLVNKAVDEVFTEALLVRDELHVRKEREGGLPLYIRAADLGDGVERVLVACIWLETLRPSLVLWDDLEAHAHPGLINVLVRWLSSRDWQVVASTHSIDVLDALLSCDAEVTVLVLRKGADDVLEHRALGRDDLEEMFDSNLDPRKLVDLL